MFHSPYCIKQVLAITLCLYQFVVAQPSPVPVQISPNLYGAEGPWQAFRIGIGSPQQEIDLFLTSGEESFVLNASFYTESHIYDPPAGAAYNVNNSKTAVTSGFTNGTPPINIDYPLQNTAAAIWGMDEIWLNYPNELQAIQNASLGIITSGYSEYPAGPTLDFALGRLSLGANVVHESYLAGANQPNVLTSWLFENKIAPSASFGLHIGSVEPSIPASLWYGGYDQSRVVGAPFPQPVGQFPTTPYWPLNLLDIGIKTATGASPFLNETAITSGLLAQGNSSLAHLTLPITVSPTTPYLFLPPSTCTAIAAQLPVSFDSWHSLYLWNTSDPQYSRIVSSASYVSFTFSSTQGSETREIKVPFKLLNLTLTQPLVTADTQYFPCQPLESSAYTLGKSFLQAAFIGANWEPDTNFDPTFFLAQAPGPGHINKAVSPTTIGPNDTNIASRTDGITWEDTWEGFWTPLPVSSNLSSPSPSPKQHSLSGGDIAGIVLGVLFFVCIAVLALTVILTLRHRSQAKQKGEVGKDDSTAIHNFTSEASNAKFPPSHDRFVMVPNNPSRGPPLHTAADANVQSVYSQRAELDDEFQKKELEGDACAEVSSGQPAAIELPTSTSTLYSPSPSPQLLYIDGKDDSDNSNEGLATLCISSNLNSSRSTESQHE